MRYWGLGICAVVLATTNTAVAQTRAALPQGVVGVAFGAAHRYKGPGKEMCVILKPLPSPAVFERGVTEVSYAVELAPKVVQHAAANVVGHVPQQLRAFGCNVFTPVKGGFSQTQLGNTISRVDGQPLASGAYRLRVTVDGQTVDIPFSIK